MFIFEQSAQELNSLRNLVQIRYTKRLPNPISNFLIETCGRLDEQTRALHYTFIIHSLFKERIKIEFVSH